MSSLIVSKWSNVQVAIQSAIAAAKTISGITLANPGVASAAAHGYSDGDFVLINADGMYQVDARMFRVDAGLSSPPNAGAFALEGEDTSAYTAFTSGTAQKITFGTSMKTAKGLTASGGDFPFLDITTIHDSVAKQVPGLASAATYEFENLWDVTDTALIALKAAADSQAQRAVKFLFAGGQVVVFNAYVGCTLLPTGKEQDVVLTKTVLTMFGRPTIYAS